MAAETDPPSLAQCADGIDNDSDGLMDFPNDPGCADALDDDETEDTVHGDLSDDCIIPERGDFEALIAGDADREVVRSANSTAGLDPWPMGGLVLHLSNRFESDFDFGVVLGGTPETGDTLEISDDDMMPPYWFSGGIDYETGNDRAGWFLGEVTVLFEKVTPAGACGTLTGEIVGMMAGRTALRELSVTIDARFWAESRE